MGSQWVLRCPLKSLSWGLDRSNIGLAVLGPDTVALLEAVPSRQQWGEEGVHLCAALWRCAHGGGLERFHLA